MACGSMIPTSLVVILLAGSLFFLMIPFVLGYLIFNRLSPWPYRSRRRSPRP